MLDYFILDLGTGLGAILLGLLVAPFGYARVFWFGAGLALLAVPLFLRGSLYAQHHSGPAGPRRRAHWPVRTLCRVPAGRLGQPRGIR